jgi:alpha/beta superfamily hydrolase
MPTTAWYQGESVKRLLQGAAVGAVATLAIGFSWGGWMLGSTAKTLADSTANSAVVAAIAPICVDQFQRSADAANNLTALQKTSSYEQAAYVEKGGWAIMPGSKAVESGVPQACAAILSNLKLK